MNLSQLMRKARFEVDAIRASGVNSALWSDEEVIDAANTAMDRAARLIRLADSNILVKTVKSTDAAMDLVSESYDPASFKMIANTVDYTLPPDFVRVEYILPLAADGTNAQTGFDGVRFTPASMVQKGFLDQSTLTETDLSTITGSQQIFYYVIVGARTLRVRPLVTESFDVELGYQYRPPRLRNISAGTITIADGSTSVHGVGATGWNTAGLRIPAELVPGSATAVSLNTVYPRILSIDSDNSLTLTRGAAGYSGVYHISMIPQLPEEHHAWLAQVTAAVMLRKVSPDLSKSALEDLDKQLQLEVQPEVVIRQVQESLAVDEYQLPG